jgi:hypothetical protein
MGENNKFALCCASFCGLELEEDHQQRLISNQYSDEEEESVERE